MNNKAQKKVSANDSVIWSIIAILLLAGVVGHYYFSHVAIAYRLIGWIVIIAASIGLASLSKSGKKIFSLLKDAINEMYKVVWPTRAETYQSTLIVIAIVAIITLLIWGIDSILVGVIGRLTGR